MTAINDITKVVNKLQQNFSRPLTLSELRKVGSTALGLLLARTKSGFGVPNSGGSKRKLKPLSGGYIKFRRRFARLSSDTSPSKSNLTLTGQMLAATKVTSVKAGTGGKAQILINPTGIKNQKKADWQRQHGRVYLNLSKTEIASVTQQISDYIKSSVKRS